jgi:hypothetical protein
MPPSYPRICAQIRSDCAGLDNKWHSTNSPNLPNSMIENRGEPSGDSLNLRGDNTDPDKTPPAAATQQSRHISPKLRRRTRSPVPRPANDGWPLTRPACERLGNGPERGALSSFGGTSSKNPGMAVSHPRIVLCFARGDQGMKLYCTRPSTLSASWSSMLTTCAG